MKKMVSDCCGAGVDWADDIHNTYTQADSYGKAWICRACSGICTPVEKQGVEDETPSRVKEGPDDAR